jgi:hypothetical protein
MSLDQNHACKGYAPCGQTGYPSSWVIVLAFLSHLWLTSRELFKCFVQDGRLLRIAGMLYVYYTTHIVLFLNLAQLQNVYMYSQATSTLEFINFRRGGGGEGGSVGVGWWGGVVTKIRWKYIEKRIHSIKCDTVIAWKESSKSNDSKNKIWLLLEIKSVG